MVRSVAVGPWGHFLPLSCLALAAACSDSGPPAQTAASITPPAAPTGAAEGLSSVPAAKPGSVITLPSGEGVMLSTGSRPGPGPRDICTVTLDGVTLDTLGAGDLDAYDCRELVEFGALPADGAMPRIGLIYRTGSANAAFNTALILIRRSGEWQLDSDSLGRYDDTPAAASLAALSATFQ